MNEEDEAFEELSRRQGDWGMQGSRKHQIMRYAENVENKGTSMTDKEAMKLALEALEFWDVHGKVHQPTEEAITALKERLSQPHETTLKEFNQLIHDDPNYYIWAKKRKFKVQGSLHVVCHCDKCKTAPQRPWVGLTEEDLKLLSAEWRIVYGAWMDDFARDIEAKLKQKNGYAEEENT